MDVSVTVEAAVLEHEHPVVAIRGVANRREDDPTGGDAGEDQRVDLPVTQLLV
jgi:hypothetical protein